MIPEHLLGRRLMSAGAGRRLFAKRSDPVGGRGHQLGGRTHGLFDGGRQFTGAERQCGIGMGGFVGFHPADDGSTALILVWQRLGPFYVTVQMSLDLALGFDDKTQIPAIAGQSGRGAEHKCPAKPERIQPRQVAVQFADPLGTPGQVVGFVASGSQQMGAQVLVASGQRLSEVERLCADLADVVDPHQPGSMALLGGAELGRFRCHGRIRPGRDRLGEHRAQQPVGMVAEPIERGQAAVGSHRGDMVGRIRMTIIRKPASCRRLTCVNLPQPRPDEALCNWLHLPPANPLPETHGGCWLPAELPESLVMNRLLLLSLSAALVSAASSVAANPAEELLKKHACVACHNNDAQLVGPAYKKVAEKYRADKNAEALLVQKILNGGAGTWGQIPMPPHKGRVSDAEALTMVKHILALK